MGIKKWAGVLAGGGSGRIKAEFPFMAEQNRVVWPAD